jgi:hypothetical protein
MSKTAALRKLTRRRLQTTPGDTYHRHAPDGAAYPYKVYTFTEVGFAWADRDDFILEVDIWDRADNPRAAEEIADQVERIFNDANLPEPPIYPTFFRENRYTMDDPDKSLQHIQLRFSVQLYETEV